MRDETILPAADQFLKFSEFFMAILGMDTAVMRLSGICSGDLEFVARASRPCISSQDTSRSLAPSKLGSVGQF